MTNSNEGWIDVKDDFPVPYREVIVFNPDNKKCNVYIDYFRTISKHEHRWNKKDGVRFWMPLPEPPNPKP